MRRFITTSQESGRAQSRGLTLALDHRSSRAGFSFVELLFAIIILGVGFVMLAGMFPVAARLTQETRDDTYGTTVARNAAQELAGMLTTDMVTSSDGTVQVFSGKAWDAINGNVILTADPRYAWVPLYRRTAESPTAQVFLIAVKARNRSTFGPDDILGEPGGVSGLPANLEPRGLDVQFFPGTDGIDVISIDPTQRNAGAVAEGAFVILANDQLTGTFNGRTYRIGTAKDAAAGLWYLQPGFDLKGDTRKPGRGHVFIVGRGYADPLHPANGFDGPAQDLGFFSTIIALRELPPG